MEIRPVDLPELVGVVLGMMMVLIPIMGATLRFAAKPLVEALAMSGILQRPVLVTESDTRRLERRVLELEQELSKLKDEKALLSGVPTAELRLRG
jgi:redox-regulated HSP33 family molecular chaperone